MNAAESNATPLVSICIPVYNRVRLVGRALESALQQRVDGLEIVVVDNCSSDGTWEFLQTISDSRVRIIRNSSNLGMFGNFSRCVEVGRGQYLRILCSDDKLLPGCIEREVEIMQANPNVVLLSSPGRTVDDSGASRGVYGDHFRSGIYRGKEATAAVLWVLANYGYNPLNLCSGLLLRRRAALETGSFDSSLSFAADLDFWLRLLAFGDLAVTTQECCEILIHAGSGSNEFALDHYMKDQFEIVRRFAECLDRAGIHRQVLCQLSGRALWYVLKALRRWNLQAACKHWEMPRQVSVHYTAALLGLGRNVLLRLRRRVLSTRLSPVEPGEFMDGHLLARTT